MSSPRRRADSQNLTSLFEIYLRFRTTVMRLLAARLHMYSLQRWRGSGLRSGGKEGGG